MYLVGQNRPYEMMTLMDIQRRGLARKKSSKECPGAFNEQKGNQCDCNSINKKKTCVR